MSQLRPLRRLALSFAGVVAISALVGCRGELLSPTECEFLAQRLAKVTSPAQFRNPRIRREVSERTNRCLVLPYDRAFLRCFGEIGRIDVCEANLISRTRRPSAQARPR